MPHHSLAIPHPFIPKDKCNYFAMFKHAKNKELIKSFKNEMLNFESFLSTCSLYKEEIRLVEISIGSSERRGGRALDGFQEHLKGLSFP